MVVIEEIIEKPNHVVFIHLDLGIGGAEQLIINLALASLRNNEKISIFTTHCSPTHCFNEVKPDGILNEYLHIHGAFIPPSLPLTHNGVRGGTAFFSTLRMIYLSLIACWKFPTADVIVLDVLPTSIPFIRLLANRVAILFYCHFPDKLLTRDTVNGISVKKISMLRKCYRFVFDALEKYTMSMCDIVVANSEFTRKELLNSFQWTSDSSGLSHGFQNIRVLHPAIDFKNFKDQREKIVVDKNESHIKPIVSLNRFERKKNVEILLEAYAMLLKEKSLPPPLIIAGGYDPRNDENAQYMTELKTLAYERLKIKNGYGNGMLSFQPNITNAQRSSLLSDAICLCYTPNREHFGIVPIEAMYAGTPVIAVNSGGPKETVVDGETGFLVENSAHGFYKALKIMIDNGDDENMLMGERAKAHVRKRFGMKTFSNEWNSLIQEVKEYCWKRNQNESFSFLHVITLLFAVIIIVIAKFFF